MVFLSLQEMWWHIERGTASGDEEEFLLEPDAVRRIALCMCQQAWPSAFGEADSGLIRPWHSGCHYFGLRQHRKQPFLGGHRCDCFEVRNGRLDDGSSIFREMHYIARKVRPAKWHSLSRCCDP